MRHDAAFCASFITKTLYPEICFEREIMGSYIRSVHHWSRQTPKRNVVRSSRAGGAKKKDIRSDVLLFWVPAAGGGLHPVDFKCSAEVNSACAKVLAFGQNACTAQKRRRPEGRLGGFPIPFGNFKISILTVPSTSEQGPLGSDIFDRLFSTRFQNRLQPKTKKREI